MGKSINRCIYFRNKPLAQTHTKTQTDRDHWESIIGRNTYMRSFPLDVWPRWRRLVVENRLLGWREVRILPERAGLEALSFDRLVGRVVVVRRRSIGGRARRAVSGIANCRASQGAAAIHTGRPSAHVPSSRHLQVASDRPPRLLDSLDVFLCGHSYKSTPTVCACKVHMVSSDNNNFYNRHHTRQLTMTNRAYRTTSCHG